jgi:hypothetical protein
LNREQKTFRFFICAGLGLLWLLSSESSVLAQQAVTATMENWRPAEGLYAAPGAGFSTRCDQDCDYMIVDLNETTAAATNGAAKLLNSLIPRPTPSGWT